MRWYIFILAVMVSLSGTLAFEQQDGTDTLDVTTSNAFSGTMNDSTDDLFVEYTPYVRIDQVVSGPGGGGPPGPVTTPSDEVTITLPSPGAIATILSGVSTLLISFLIGIFITGLFVTIIVWRSRDDEEKKRSRA